MMRHSMFVICVAFASIVHSTANAAELKVFASRAVWTVLMAIGPDFEKTSGYKLTTTTGLSGDFVRRINSGETFDVIAAPPASLEGLIRGGKILTNSRTGIARSGYGVVVRAGAQKPEIGSIESFKRTLLNAKSITYLPVPGVPQLIEKLGLKDVIASKVIIPNDDISAELVAKGDVELGIVAATQAFTTPGIELADVLPAEIQIYTEFSAAIGAASANPDAARRLLVYLTGPKAKETIRAQGMEPL
jgi:molybdate transport system substrate-binding protein